MQPSETRETGCNAVQRRAGLQAFLQGWGLGIVLGAIAVLLAWWISGCSDKSSSGGKCPESLSVSSAEWIAGPTQDAECVALADALNESAFEIEPDMGECTGSMMQRVVAGECQLSIAAECDELSYALACVVGSNGDAECDATIEAAELESGSCRLRVLLR